MVALTVLSMVECAASQRAASPAASKQIVRLDRTHQIWIYRPQGRKGRRPLVLIGPAGSPLYSGMTLGSGDEPEHTPYVQAGCIVVSYDISGPVSQGDRNPFPAIREFMDSDMGIKDAQRALNYALRNIPEVDPHRVIAIGHSSAATLALQVTESDPRITACVAYAPVTDVPQRIGRVVSRIERSVPGFSAKVQQLSPATRAHRIHRPLFLFHANDDTNVPATEVRQFAAAVPKSKLVEVPTGGHYNSMLQQGMPAALKWLRSLGFMDK